MGWRRLLRTRSEARGKFVLQVSVEGMPADTAWDRVYTEPVKIEAILDYIQALHTVPPETGEQEVKEEASL